MNNEESMNLRMQNLLKKRRVEKKRFDDEIKSIELSERKVLLAYERTRLDFLNLVNTKRRRWWLSDENVRREFAKREWKIGFTRPDSKSETAKDNSKTLGKQSTLQKRSNLSDSSSGLSDDNEENQESDDDEDEDNDDDNNADGENSLRVNYLIERLKRSKSSVAKFSSSIQYEESSIKKSRPNTSLNINTYDKKQSSDFSAVQRPITSFVIRQTSSFRELNEFKMQSKKDSQQKKEPNMLELSVLIDKFLVNTPRNVERTICLGANEKIVNERQERLKNKINLEKENSKKKDLRYFELVNCLSEPKI